MSSVHDYVASISGVAVIELWTAEPMQEVATRFFDAAEFGLEDASGQPMAGRGSIPGTTESVNVTTPSRMSNFETIVDANADIACTMLWSHELVAGITEEEVADRHAAVVTAMIESALFTAGGFGDLDLLCYAFWDRELVCLPRYSWDDGADQFMRWRMGYANDIHVKAMERKLTACGISYEYRDFDETWFAGRTDQHKLGVGEQLRGKSR